MHRPATRISGLDFDGHTHAELYEDFAEALTGGDLWQLRKYRLPEAQRFSHWVYRNMVVEAIPDGLHDQHVLGDL